MTEMRGSDGASDRVSRRRMLQAAVAAGVGAATWTAPHITSIGFVAAAATPIDPGGCVILSPASDDKTGTTDAAAYCSSTTSCCGETFGNGGQIEQFTFTNPAPNCTQVVVRTIPLDCTATAASPFRNPDVGQFAVVIESTTGAGCGACEVLDAVLLSSSGRDMLKTFNSGPVACAPAGPIGDGVDASIPCDEPLLATSAKLAVRLVCDPGPADCPD